MTTASSAPTASPASPIRGIAQTLLRVAWSAVAIGVLLEAILVAITAIGGGRIEFPAILADLVQKISWSALVCAGLALGTGASRARAQWMGLLGLLAAPAAFATARALHKAATQALGAPPIGAGAPSVLTLAILKAIEYGVLGFGLAMLARRPGATLRAHLALGAAVGAATAAVVLGLAIVGAATAPGPLTIALRVANEVLFPVGCAAVLWTATSAWRGAGRGVRR